MQETQVRFLGQENSLEEEMATHSSILVWKILWTYDPGGLQSMESRRVRHDWATKDKHKNQEKCLEGAHKSVKRNLQRSQII